MPRSHNYAAAAAARARSEKLASGGYNPAAHFGPQPIQLLAEQLNIEGFDQDTAEELSVEVEYRLRQIIEVAKKFMKHSKRDVMTTQDVDCALRLLNVESLYGYSSSDPVTFEKNPAYEDVFYVKDQTVSFQSILEEKLPKCPKEPTFSVHWLAVEGQQPKVPQNPSFEHPLDNGDELDESAQAAAEDADKKDSDKHMKQAVKHVLSKEQQLYYERVTDAIKSGNRSLHRVILNSLANDAGLHQLLPYLVQFIADEVVHNLRKLSLLFNLMRMAEALLSSPHLHVTPYLHQLMPPIMTCLIGRYLCSDASENHWKLRDFSAELLASICKRYGPTYPDLQPRIVQQLCNAYIDLSNPLTTHYGAIVGLTAFGDKVIQVTLMRHMKAYLGLLMPTLSLSEAEAKKKFGDANHAVRLVEARRCYGALLEAVGGVVRQYAYAMEYTKLLEQVSKELARSRSRSKRSRDKEKSLNGKGKKVDGSAPESGPSKKQRTGNEKREGDDEKVQASTEAEGESTNMDEEEEAKTSDVPSESNGVVGKEPRSEEGRVVKDDRLLAWTFLYDLFGEQILPYSKVHLHSESENEGLTSLGDLFL